MAPTQLFAILPRCSPFTIRHSPFAMCLSKPLFIVHAIQIDAFFSYGPLDHKETMH
jgi:hypothetical protein